MAKETRRVGAVASMFSDYRDKECWDDLCEPGETVLDVQIGEPMQDAEISSSSMYIDVVLGRDD